VLRLWFTRRWLLATLAALVFAAACWVLGSWQWGRYEDKLTKVTAIETNYDAPPAPIDTVFRGGALPPEAQWTRVTVTGTYVADTDLLVRNRTLNNVVGFEVLTPLQTDSGVLLVDRGWVPNAATAVVSPEVDAPPSGPVEVTGWLRTGEPSLGRDLPADQLASVSIADARGKVSQLGATDVYVVLGAQSPPTVAAGHPLTVLPRPEEDLGPHQAYAIQWWLTMPGGLIFVIWAMRRRLAPTEEPEAGVEGERVRVPAKPKKVRIWDEEDY
jgi:cytochrome oxidase assembly protein ShyY1